MNRKVKYYIGPLFLLVLFLLGVTGLLRCNRNHRVKLIEVKEEQQAGISIDAKKIYRYNYSTFGNIYQEWNELTVAHWDPNNANNIIINEYDPTAGTLHVRSVDYRYGFFDEIIVYEKRDDVFLISCSYDKRYMLLEVRTEKERLIIIYDIETKEYEQIAAVDIERFPTDRFEIESVWIPKTNVVVYGWKFNWYYVQGDKEMQEFQVKKGQSMGFPTDYYELCYYDMGTKKQSVDVIMKHWMEANMLFNYELLTSEDGRIFFYTRNDDENWFEQDSAILQYNEDGKVSVVYPEINANMFTNFWFTDTGIYAQSNTGGLYIYDETASTSNWVPVIEDKESTILDLTVSKDGKRIYVAEASEIIGTLEESIIYRYYSEKTNIFVYSTELKKKEYLYKSAGNVVEMELSEDENKLLVEMKEGYTVEENGYNVLMKTFVFQF